MFILEVRPAEDMNAYKAPLLFILRNLASHPSEAGLRTQLGSAPSVEASGSAGLPVLASFALDVIAARGARLQKTPPAAANLADEECLIDRFYAHANN